MISSKVELKWKGNEVKIIGKKVTGKTSFELGLIVEGNAKLLCPIDLGYLAASITVQSKTQGTEMSTVKPSGNIKLSKSQRQEKFWSVMPANFRKINKPESDDEVLIGTPVEYGPWVEFGTKKMDAQPFLRPALDLAKGKTIELLLVNGKMEFKDYLK